MIRKQVAIGATLLSILLVGSWSTSTAIGSEFSCHDRVLTDYARLLRKMPPSRLPVDALPFAPEGVVLRPPKSVIVRGEPIAFTLMLNRSLSPDRSIARPAKLGWVFNLRLESVDRLGRFIDVSRERSWRLGQIRTPERQFDFRAGPGFYRVAVRSARSAARPSPSQGSGGSCAFCPSAKS